MNRQTSSSYLVPTLVSADLPDKRRAQCGVSPPAISYQEKSVYFVTRRVPMFHLPRSRNYTHRVAGLAVALIGLTISATLLSHRSSAASSHFNDKPHCSKPSSRPFPVPRRTTSSPLQF